MAGGSARDIQDKVYKRLGLTLIAPRRQNTRDGGTLRRKLRHSKDQTPKLPHTASPLLKRKRQLEGCPTKGGKTVDISRTTDDTGDSELPRKIRRRTSTLSDDDARIAELERKLGIKNGKRERPKSSPDDGWNDLVEPFAEDESLSHSDDATEYVQWLKEKRNNRESACHIKIDCSAQNGIHDLASVVPSVPTLNDDSSQCDFLIRASRVRENPYAAPPSNTTASYVPPSRRRFEHVDTGANLHRKIQGQINRLTEDNMLSIVRALEDLYQTNARGDVTSTIINVLMAQICKPEMLNDPFLILAGGFVSALYKVVGASFGSPLLMRTAGDLGSELERARIRPSDQGSWQKEPANLATFMSALYVFDVVGHDLIFEYLHLLLGDLSELHAELILRIVHIAGRLLRRDDAAAFKNVVSALNKSVAATNRHLALSSRCKYIVETINDFNANRKKPIGSDTALIPDHVQRMKKRLGELKAQSWRRLDGTTALGLSLRDIKQADAKGRWWLVGASVSATTTAESSNFESARGGSPSDPDLDLLLPDYSSRARQLGFSTGVQVSIFTAVMSATDAEHGFQQFLALGLNARQRRELSRVLVQCAASEGTYNPYYALVAKQACSNSAAIRFSFQDQLWGVFKRLGEPIFGDDSTNGDRDDLDSEMMADERTLKNVGTFFGALIFDSSLPITVLKPLDLHNIRGLTRFLIERVLITILRACTKISPRKRSAKVEKIFSLAREPVTLATGVHFLLELEHRKAMDGNSGSKFRETLVAAQETLLGNNSC